MLAFPNIKINLGLSITEKRPDGYHNLETVFYPVALEDAPAIRKTTWWQRPIHCWIRSFIFPLSKFIYISIFPREPDWGAVHPMPLLC